MSDDYKIEIINGVEYEQHEPYCEICKAHMGQLYNEKKGWINPNNYEDYSDNTCPNCGQEYQYIEGDSIVLTDTQLEVLRGTQ